MLVMLLLVVQGQEQDQDQELSRKQRDAYVWKKTRGGGMNCRRGYCRRRRRKRVVTSLRSSSAGRSWMSAAQ